jgi:phospholipase C
MRIDVRGLAAALGLACSAAAGAAVADIPQVQHVVVIFQENRTPDNLFHGLQAYLPGADIATGGVNSKGQTITLTPVPLANDYDLGHQHSSFLAMYDNGKMDGADLVDCIPFPAQPCPANPQFKYVQPADVAPYFWLAINYSFANRMFQSNQGASFPAHQFILAGTSQVTATNLYFAGDNPVEGFHGSAGCDAPPGKTVDMIGPHDSIKYIFPCFEHATLTDLLDNPPPGARQGLTWRYYAPNESGIWTAPNAVRHMCVPSGTPPICNGPPFANGQVVIDSAQVLRDISANALPSVSWVIPTGQESDHAKGNDGTGPAWVASIVNAIGNSAYWNSTVILISWDDWGGWYDHVAPPIDPMFPWIENSFRVPLIVVSPYTPAGYVSQTTHTFGSILKFIETAYGLPLIPPGTFADSRSDALMDFFNFNAPPRPFQTVPSSIPEDFFLHDKRPRTNPDND